MTADRIGKGIIALLFSLVIAASHAFNFAQYPLRSDFSLAFYNAGRVVLAGEGPHLYDVAVQRRFQLDTFHSTGQPFNNPPATALLYVPFAAFDVKTAFFLWTLMSMGIVFWSASALHGLLKVGGDAFTTFALFAAFLPLHAQLIQGQVDIVALGAFTAVLIASSRGRDWRAGLWLAVALVKFQFAVPFGFVFLLRRRWKVVGGMAFGTLVFLIVCVAVSGIGGVLDYVWYIRDLDRNSGDAIHPRMMANIRGLAFVALGRDLPWAVTAIAGAAVLVVMSRRGQSNVEMAAAGIVAALLASPHQNPHSLILLLVPLAVAAQSFSWRTPAGICLVGAGSPVLYLPLILARQMGWMAVPLAAFAWLNFRSASHSPVPPLRAPAAW